MKEMKRRIFSLILILMFVFSLVSLIGCGKTDEQKKKEGYKDYKNLGLKYIIGEGYVKYDDNLVLDGLGDSEDENEPIYGGRAYSFISDELISQYEEAVRIEDKDERSTKLDEIFDSTKQLFGIAVFRANKVGMDIDNATGFKNNEKLGKKGDYEFYFCYADYDESELSEKAKEMYKKLYDNIKNIKKSIKISRPVTTQESLEKLGKIKFNLKDLEGKEHESSDVFKNSKLTMINIWATFCGPCKQEMPDIQKLNDELKDENVTVIGIIGDTPNAECEAAAAKIIEKNSIKYLNLIPDEKFKKDVLSCIEGYPTTIFVDNNGKVVGKLILGSRTKDEYKEAIEEILKILK